MYYFLFSYNDIDNVEILINILSHFSISNTANNSKSYLQRSHDLLVLQQISQLHAFPTTYTEFFFFFLTFSVIMNCDVSANLYSNNMSDLFNTDTRVFTRIRASANRYLALLSSHREYSPLGFQINVRSCVWLSCFNVWTLVTELVTDTEIIDSSTTSERD